MKKKPIKYARRGFFAALTVFAAVLVAEEPGKPASASGPVYVLNIDGTIDPVIAKYVADAFAEAKEENAAAVVIRLDTPGGLLDATRDIIQQILNAPMPAIVYVSPRGSRAASAGVFITVASDVAAMAPETHLGAAHPVSLGGNPFMPAKPADPEKNGKEDEGRSVMEEKIVSDTAAYARTLASAKGRNADWVEKAVRESLSLTSTEALEKNVVDMLAEDETDLFKKLSPRDIKKNEKVFRIDFEKARMVRFEMGRLRQVLHVLANPNVAYLLLMLGFYALIYEFATPGIGLGAAAGLISLVMAFFALQVLPLSYAGLALLLAGMTLMAMELFVVSHGLLMVGGTLCFIAGSLLLFESPEPYFRVSLEIIGGTAVASLAFLVFVVKKILAVRVMASITGKEALVGQIGEARPDGMVFVHGEYWEAESAAPLSPGQKVRVVEVMGNRLRVEKV
ncbi:MAG TPA: nodulation protein NfeD [Elusimicrobiota bacterium]|nr:nodulation protein NfeD [Elusimicrobiota bacterium]